MSLKISSIVSNTTVASAFRYEKLTETFLAFVTFATILDWLHFKV
jgi:hypothetical protein